MVTSNASNEPRVKIKLDKKGGITVKAFSPGSSAHSHSSTTPASPSTGSRPSPTDDLPEIHYTQLELGKVLGKGGYCDVAAVKKIKESAIESRRSDDPLALKRVRSDLDKDKYKAATRDLMTEVELLSAIAAQGGHRNIVGLHAIGFCDELKGKIRFILLDRLGSSLKDRIDEWAKYQPGIMASRRAHHAAWTERMDALIQIVDAVQFLHSRGIIHRDLNIGNIGFDIQDGKTPKIFDFGLARKVESANRVLNDNRDHTCVSVSDEEDDIEVEIRKDDTSNEDHEDGDVLNVDLSQSCEKKLDLSHKEPNDDSNNKDDDIKNPDDMAYEMTAKTGTMRFMAPEVAWGKPYGLKADVYSLAVITFHILALKDPWKYILPSQFSKEIFVNRYRPDDETSWPMCLQKLQSSMWDDDWQKRPTVAEILKVLKSLDSDDSDEHFPRTYGISNFFRGRDSNS